MYEFIKTVFMMSCVGAGLTLLLLAIKPLTVKKFPARWQYAAWLVVIVCMLVPVWKLIPVNNAQEIAPDFVTMRNEQNTASEVQEMTQMAAAENLPMEYREIAINSKEIHIYDLIAWVWICGVCLFLISVFGSYFIFLIRKKRNSVDLKGNKVLEDVKRELDIKRKIRIRISNDAASPMLVGVLFPVIYIPHRSVDETAERLIYRHELMHYKHKDLIFKWFALIVNAIHWFNPFAYLVSANISEACEVSCDMSVIKDLDEQEQRLYMNTILDLVQAGKRRERNV